MTHPSAAAITDADGLICGRRATLQDITALKRTERELRDAEQNLLTAIGAAWTRGWQPAELVRQIRRDTDAVQKIDSKDFQRWSRHRTAQNPWKIGRVFGLKLPASPINPGVFVALGEVWSEVHR